MVRPKKTTVRGEYSGMIRPGNGFSRRQLRAQAMSAYMIVDIQVTDQEKYAQYVEAVRQVVDKHGGCYLVRGGMIFPRAGNWKPERMIVIEFDSRESVRRCLGSPEYRAIAPLREQSTISRAIIVEGMSGESEQAS